ncbi:multidrug transporter subunit MdtO [Silvibacterium dinghuense]|nr:multidrug transporter subunit MdtO [Silvibacterium dinghuense]
MQWFPDFLRAELAPYPGRGAIVARMVIAATISMILVQTFRVPGGAIGALFAFTLSRENLRATAQSALSMMVACALTVIFVPVGARMFASEPMTHFLWEGISIFLIFFLLRALSDYAVAVGLSLVVTSVLGIWYLPGPTEHNVELTLWQVLAAAIGAVVTLAVEAAFHAMKTEDEVTAGLKARLTAVEKLLRSFAGGSPVSKETERTLTQYALVGMGSLRRHIIRGSYDGMMRMRMSTVVSLVGRGTDFAAAMVYSHPPLSEQQMRRAAALASHVAEMRKCVIESRIPAPWQPETSREADNFPLFSELESMMALIPTAYDSEATLDPQLAIQEGEPERRGIFVSDAFSNREYVRYAMGGTLAAMLCYVLYVSLAWPALATSVTTCVLTALTNIGASRQKQVLRIGGALLGGFVFALGGQIFILPYVDTIGGFTLFFVSITFIAAWVSTSSSRLSYAGIQIALAFYLINLGDFTIQTSLTQARDRSIGVLLGTTAMWVVFERLYPKAAADEMVRIFIRNLRLMAELAEVKPGPKQPDEMVRIRRQRDQVYRLFADVNAQSDAVPFETGPKRAAHLAARDRIRRWQAQLRTFYLHEVPLLQFRVFGDPHGVSPEFLELETRFHRVCGETLSHIADCLDRQAKGQACGHAEHPRLEAMIDTSKVDESAALSVREHALVRMSRQIAAIIDRLEAEVTSEPLYG